MDSMIKEINDKLKAIIDSIKSDKDNAIDALNNIQNQMDNKIEEAKGYKEQVDSAKQNIRVLEDENNTLEESLKELNDKYSKMNLVSVIEAGNKEIKNKINDNNKAINKEKEHIADLTNKARAIKDLLINLKKDKTLKEEKLENINVIYDYYTDRVNTVIDYAFDHANTLNEYKDNTFDVSFKGAEDVEEVKDIDIDNTMVFDQIANIDDLDIEESLPYIDNDNEEKDLEPEEEKNEDVEVGDIESTSDVVDNYNNDFDKETFNEIIKSGLDQYNSSQDNNEDVEGEPTEETEKIQPSETTQLFNTIENIDDNNVEDLNNDLDTSNQEVVNNLEEFNNVDNSNNIFDVTKENEVLDSVDNSNIEEFKKINTDIFNKEVEDDNLETLDDDNDSQDRINKINDLFSSINTSEVTPLNNIESLDSNTVNSNIEQSMNSGVEQQIDSAYKDIFGVPLEEKDLNAKNSTLTDIFGNPIKQEELSEEVKIGKKIEELFNENGIDFNRFKEDEQNYLKQIYDEDKYSSIINVLKENKINLDNIYHAFNIFGEITPDELNNIISKLIGVGQSTEAIGFILEKLPKVKKYDLDLAISSFGSYINDVDITELIMKAKELYNNGGNN